MLLRHVFLSDSAIIYNMNNSKNYILERIMDYICQFFFDKLDFSF